MKKLFVLILTLGLLCISAAALANKPYIHPDFKLHNVREVKVTQIDNQENYSSERFTNDEAAELKTLSAVLEAAGRHKMVATDMRNNPELERSGLPVHAPTAVEMRVIINSFGYKTVDVPGHYETYTAHETRHYYDRDGIRHTYTEPVQRQRWNEPYSYKIAYLNLMYSFYDIPTGTLIASLSDSRERNYESDPANGMLGRSVRDCFNKVFKN